MSFFSSKTKVEDDKNVKKLLAALSKINGGTPFATVEEAADKMAELAEAMTFALSRAKKISSTVKTKVENGSKVIDIYLDVIPVIGETLQSMEDSTNRSTRERNTAEDKARIAGDKLAAAELRIETLEAQNLTLLNASKMHAANVGDVLEQTSADIGKALKTKSSQAAQIELRATQKSLDTVTDLAHASIASRSGGGNQGKGKNKGGNTDSSGAAANGS